MPSEPDILAELFVRLAAGDRSAIPQTFRILHPLLQGFCDKLLGRGADADDATQQTLERVFEEIGTYDIARKPLPWVFTIAAWEVRTIRRRASRTEQRSAALGVEDLRSTSGDPETAAMLNQLLSAVNSLIEGLPELDRDTIQATLRREFAGQALGPSDPTFRKRKERAFQRMRSLLRNLGHVQ